MSGLILFHLCSIILIFRIKTFLKILVVSFTLLTSTFVRAQLNVSVDSLLKLTEYYIEVNEIDSANTINQNVFKSPDLKDFKKGKAYLHKAYILRFKKEYTTCMDFCREALVEFKNAKAYKEIAETVHLMGSAQIGNNNPVKGVELYIKALKVREALRDSDAMLSSYMGIGIFYKLNFEKTKGLQYLLKAFEIAEKLNETNKIFTCCINLGTLYEMTNDFNKASSFYQRALDVNSKSNDAQGIAIVATKLAKLYLNFNNTDSAEFFVQKSLKIHQQKADALGLYSDYSILGGIADMKDDFNSYAHYNSLCGEIALARNDSMRLHSVYSGLAKVYLESNKYADAYKNFVLAKKYLNKDTPPGSVFVFYRNFSKVCEALNKDKEALENFKLFKLFEDSTFNVAETKKQTELKLNFEFDKTQNKLKEEAREKEIQNKLELEKEKQQRNFLLIILTISGLALFVSIRSIIARKKANFQLEKQKLKVEQQKKILEEKNKEISDSINYARRIQNASLPEKVELDSFFNNYAFVYKPKDVVSGDFYWAAKTDTRSFLVVADCTGHGVPGSITSMIGSMLLNEIFYVKKIYQVDEILKELNRLVKLTLRQTETSESKDGMDCAIIMYNSETNELDYAGANRPLYLVLNNQLKEFKATKASIGGHTIITQTFELNRILVSKGERVVLCSDGYADQFGGEKSKKIGTKMFKEIITSDYQNPQQLINSLDSYFTNWKKHTEQTDDVLVFCVEV